MVRRSMLFTPGDDPKKCRNALRTNADVVVLDLEDAVVPDRKSIARETTHDLLTDQAIDWSDDRELCVRLTGAGERARTDLEALTGDSSGTLRLDGVVVPKVTDAEAVRSVVRELETRELDVSIFALVETARGVLSAPEIAAVPQTDALVFGAEDLAADIGATRSPEGTETVYAQQRVVIAAAAEDCTAIDTVYTDFKDPSGLRSVATRAAALGFDGKLAIHPAQIDPIHDAFTPNPEEIDWARRIVAAHEDAVATDRGVFDVDGTMVDAPVVDRAHTILERARAADRDRSQTE